MIHCATAITSNRPSLSVLVVITAVTGNQRNDVVIGVYLNARIIKSLGLCPLHKCQEVIIVTERSGSGVPFAVDQIDHGEDGIFAQAIEGVKVNCFVGFIETALFI